MMFLRRRLGPRCLVWTRRRIRGVAVLFCEAIISAIFFVFFFSFFHYLSTLSHTALGGVKLHWSWRYMFSRGYQSLFSIYSSFLSGSF